MGWHSFSKEMNKVAPGERSAGKRAGGEEEAVVTQLFCSHWLRFLIFETRFHYVTKAGYEL